MNKTQFIEREIAKNKQAFGKWASTKKKNSADEVRLMFEEPPKNEEEALQHGNALANTGNYPVGTSGCFNIGISGGCGPDCFVYLNGDCSEPQEIIPRLDSDGLNLHAELYG